MPIFRFQSRILLFVHIPKTGGTSVEKMLKDAGGIEAMRNSEQIPNLPCTPQHFHAEIVERLIPDAFYDFAFTIVRNPYDRLVSEFKMRVVAAGRDLSFDAWVDRTLVRYSRNRFANDNHIRPQTEYLFGNVQIYRFEDNPLSRVADQLRTFGIQAPPDMPWERRGAAASFALSARTISLIRELYAKDFERLGYRQDDYGPSLEPSGES
jgi:hypothetical protein